MASDTFFSTTLRNASQSHEFQQLLRLNPALARTSGRDRDRIVLDFLRAKKHSKDYIQPPYAAAILNGYDPSKPPVSYLPPTPPPPVRASPILTTLVCGGQNGFTLGRAGADRTNFDLTPSVGTGVFYNIDVSAMDSSHQLRVTLHDLTDACGIYYGYPGAATALDNDYTHYQSAASDGINSATQIVFSFYRTTTYPGSIIPLVVLHTGLYPFVYGTISVICEISL